MADNIQAKDANGVVVTIRTKDTAGVHTEQIGMEAGSQTDGHSATLGATTDAAVATSTAGTLSAKLRGLIALFLGAHPTDTAAFTEGADTFVTLGAVFGDSVTVLSASVKGLLRMTAWRALHTNVRDASGNELLTSAHPGLFRLINGAGNEAGTNTAPWQITLRDTANALFGTSTNPINATLRNTSNVELFTSTTPGQTTQAALSVGIDKVAATAITPVAVVITGNGAAQQIVASPGSGHHLRIWAATFCQKSTGTYGDVGYRPGSGGTNVEITTIVAQGQSGGRRFSPNYWDLADNTALYSSANPTGQDIIYNIDYETITP